MKVRDLVELLQQAPQDVDVRFRRRSGERTPAFVQRARFEILQDGTGGNIVLDDGHPG